MARNMDKFAVDRNAMKKIDAEIAKHSKIVSQLRKERQVSEARIMKAMRTSTEGNINGELAFRKTSTERRSVTIGRVLEFAPEKAESLIQTKTSYKIEVV